MSSANTLSADQLKDLQAAIRDGRCALIDVRERHEHEAGHIPLSVNRPLSQLASWYDALDRGQMVVLYCRTENRARSCAEALQARGFREVNILEGGYSAWSRSALARE